MARKFFAVLFSLAVFISLMGFEPSEVISENCGAQEYMQADCSGFVGPGAGEANNVILLIGDGMGINQVYAGRVLVNGPDQPLLWETLPHRGLVKTCSIGAITDSAASGTAMATGHKTKNGMVSMTVEPEVREAPNVLDLIHDRKAVGVVTTSSVWDATPCGLCVPRQASQPGPGDSLPDDHPKPA